MQKGMHPQAVFFIGLPGSGKDTQAELLAEEYGFEQVPSSKLLQKKFESDPNDPIIQREVTLNKEGKLNSGPFVADVIMEFVEPRAKQGAGFVFSGSPRAPEEAKIEIPAMQQLYGDENVILIMLDLSEEDARWRIEHRRFCKANKHPIPWTPETKDLTICPIDGSELYVRKLDNPELIEVRFKEYEELTKPTIKVFEEYGVPIFHIDATKSIEGMHQDIAAALERRRQPLAPN